METKHTKGEWVYYEVPDYNKVLSASKIEIGSTGSSAWICKVQNDGVIGDEEGLANAKLIASAPELLEALVELEKLTFSLNVDVDGLTALALKACRGRVINAINKATK